MAEHRLTRGAHAARPARSRAEHHGRRHGWPAKIGLALVGLEYVVKILAVGIVPENRRPSSSTGWLLLILFLPVVGVPLFLLLGSPYVHRRRAQIQARANTLLETGTTDVPTVPDSVSLPDDLEAVVKLARSLTALPMVTATNHGIVMDYETSIRRMAELVGQAHESVSVEIYTMARDTTTDGFFDALENASRRGVKVRLLLDHLGSFKYPGYHDLLKRLSSAGVEWYLMMPFLPLQGKLRRPDLRNHRKLLVVDGKVAVMGSQNMIEAPYLSKKNHKIGRRWNDITIQLSGEIVSSLEAVFAVDWYTESGQRLDIHAYRDDSRTDTRIDTETSSGTVDTADDAGERAPAPPRGLQNPGGAPRGTNHVLPNEHGSVPTVGGEHNAVQLIPSGPGFRTDPNLRVFTSLIYTARERLSIVSPYFVPDESLLGAIITAAHRGVAVDLYVSEVADQFAVDRAQSSYYQALLEAGVRIYLYPKPQVLHTKCFVIDDTCAVMGSSNMDLRSFGLDYEISLLAYGGDIVTQLQDVINTYAAKSTLLDPDSWAKRSPVRKYTESVMRLTSALQ